MSIDTKTSTFISIRAKLHGVAQRLLTDTDDVNDALQELFIRVWQNKTVAKTDEQRKAFMFTTLRNICIDMIRRRRNSVDVDGNAEVNRLPDESQTKVEDVDTLDNIRTQIRRKISGTTLRVFEMYTYEEKDYDEIADELNITKDVARSYMCRARKIIREQCRDIMYH